MLGNDPPHGFYAQGAAPDFDLLRMHTAMRLRDDARAIGIRRIYKFFEEIWQNSSVSLVESK